MDASKHIAKRTQKPLDEAQSSGDEKLMMLINEHEPLLRHIIRSNVHNQVDVDDVFQETLLSVLEHFRAGKSVKHPKAWMAKIAKSKCIDFHRRQEKEASTYIDLAFFIGPAAFGGGVSIADEQHQAAVAKEIYNVIMEMKFIYRDVGELHIQGYTDREISNILEIAEGTVKSRLRQFRRLIKEYLEVDTPALKKKKA